MNLFATNKDNQLPTIEVVTPESPLGVRINLDPVRSRITELRLTDEAFHTYVWFIATLGSFFLSTTRGKLSLARSIREEYPGDDVDVIASYLSTIWLGRIPDAYLEHLGFDILDIDRMDLGPRISRPLYSSGLIADRYLVTGASSEVFFAYLGSVLAAFSHDSNFDTPPKYPPGLVKVRSVAGRLDGYFSVRTIFSSDAIPPPKGETYSAHCADIPCTGVQGFKDGQALLRSNRNYVADWLDSLEVDL